MQSRDGVALQLRVGLNSGRVIAGEIGSGSLGYAATGEPIGFAQRMESVAPPGGVMVSESTARLVEHTVVLADRVGAHQGGRRTGARAPAAGDQPADFGGRGGVVVSRAAREAAALAAGRGVDVVWTFCESHTRDVPFHALTRMLRAGTGIADVEGEAARARVQEQVPDADPEDLLLLDDLLGVADPELPLPQIDADARRRRLTALINATSLTRTEPVLYVHRGCALDRCVQRVDAGRLTQSHSAHAVDGADHYPPGV